MQTLNIHGIDEETLQGFANLASRAYQYCLRQCGKWGSPTCFSCMFRDVRKLHDKATSKRNHSGTNDNRKG